MSCDCDKNKGGVNKNFTSTVLEINNPEKLILFRKVIIPVSLGDRNTLPPEVGRYKNVLLEYEADESLFLYSSDGIPTELSADVSEFVGRLNALTESLALEADSREAGDTALQTLINAETTAREADVASLTANLATEASTREDADIALQTAITNEATARTTADNSLQSAINTETSARTSADTSLQSAIDSEATARANAITSVQNSISAEATARASADTALGNRLTTVESEAGTALQPSDVDYTVMSDLNVNSTPSTSVLQLDANKVNISTGVTSTKNIALPVASATQAGILNSATFNAIANNTNSINALTNGAVAVNGLSANPTQSEVTTAWQTETGLSTLINRASVYDVTNEKVWTYYSNDATWYSASNTAQVSVNTFTNTSEGVIKGSTSAGQVFAESNGTGSVNGWDTLTASVADNTAAIATKQDKVSGKGLSTNDFTNAYKTKLDGIATGAEVNVQPDWSTTDTTADSFIKNKPTIPTVNNATLTIQKNGTSAGTFTANASANKTINITVPTAVSELTNDSGYTTNAGTITKVQANGTNVATSGTANIPAASTSAYGVTKLSTSTSSTSTALAATASAVKSAYDLANGKPTITMQTTDPGAGSTLAANNFIAVYTA